MSKINDGGWKDITSHSQGDKERVPSTWELRLTNDIRIVVLRTHRADPDNWTMHCSPWFDTRNLALPSTVENRDEAQRRALRLVRAKIWEVYDALSARLSQEGE